jgi:hypothetical protein
MIFQQEVREFDSHIEKHLKKLMPEGIHDEDIREFRQKIKKFEKEGIIIRYLDFGWVL